MSEFVFTSSDAPRLGVTAKVRGAQTGDAYTVLELVLPPGAGAPLHVHQREDEVFYVIDGAVEIQHGGQTYTAEAGAVIVLPKGQPHAFRNPGETPNRILITAIPGGLDRYFDEINALGADATPEQVKAVNDKYSIDFSPGN
jgi:quercetin dioxygenase-like cupin family protein